MQEVEISRKTFLFMIRAMDILCNPHGSTIFLDYCSYRCNRISWRMEKEFQYLESEEIDELETIYQYWIEDRQIFIPAQTRCQLEFNLNIYSNTSFL